jgi:signal transduction histidine kinase
LGIRAILETEPEELDLPQDVERELYYVLREGLTNVTRHSHASRAEIHLRQKGNDFDGTLEDDGVGLNLMTTNSHHGVGLTSMRERIENLGGRFSIKSAPGSGTKISFSLPIETKSRALAVG